MLHVLGCITEEHDLRLVVVAAVISLVACFTTVNLLARALSNSGPLSWCWTAGAAVMFGSGVWSLHFVAMLGFLPNLRFAYDLNETLASMLVASLGALSSFAAWRTLAPRPLAILGGGVLLGVAITAMHYIGIDAMRTSGTISLDRGGVLASAGLSVGFSVLALARCGRLVLLRSRVEAALWLSIAVCGLHFTGMAAMHLGPPTAEQTRLATGLVLGSGGLAVAVGAVSLAVLTLSLVGALLDQHLTERNAREAIRLRRIADVTMEGILIQRDGIVLEANDAFCRLLGRRLKEVIGRRVSSLFSEPSARLLAGCLSGGQYGDGTPLGEVEACAASGALINVELIPRSIDYDGRQALALAVRDLTAKKRDEERIRHLAQHDPLTDLPNRLLLEERLAHALEFAARSGGAVALLYLDLDRFKSVNDLLGHGCGDALLVAVVRRFSAALRPTDTLARMGGDEFVIVIPGADQPHGAALLAGRLQDLLSEPFLIDGSEAEIGVSIGISFFPHDGLDGATLLRHADTALYRSKIEGRGTYRLFEPAMDQQLRRRRLLEQDLRHAVERGEMELHYQPLVNCESGELEGFEALVRWHHPERGLIPPMEFIPLAEATGAIERIGLWVLKTACAEAATWPSRHCVAVNLSPMQFRGGGLARSVAAALEKSGLAPVRLELEITESVLLDAQLRPAETLAELRALGVRLSLDDFGTGYSSLSYLRRFPFDKIKIDKSFMAEIEQDTNGAAIVRAIIGLGHNLKLTVTAEGVEHPVQLEVLRALGCDQVQGFLVGRPSPRAVFPEPAPASHALAGSQREPVL